MRQPADCELVHAPLAHWARERAHAPAVSDGSRTLSFAELHASVAARAQAYTAAAAPAEVLVDMDQPQLDQLLDFLAIVASGRCAALGDPDWPAPLRAAARASLSTAPGSLAPAHALAPFYMGFTSGSTGQPKGFCRTHQSWTASFRVCVKTFGQGAVLPMLVPGRLSHSLFLFGAMLGLWTGAGLVLQERFSASAALARLAAQSPASLVAVPSQLLLMLDLAAQRKLAPLTQVGLVMISGARWPRQHSAALQALFPRARLVEFYGASELSFVAWTPVQAALPVALVGQPFDGVDVDIRPLPPALQAQAPDWMQAATESAAPVGLIWVRSPMVFSHYAGAAQSDGSACLRDGDWLCVRDVGFRDPQGRLHLLGRLNRMIVTQAKKLFPEELESVLEAHACIAQASVHGVPDALRGASVVALVLLKPEAQHGTALTAAALMQWCRARLQPYKTPRHIYVCAQWHWTRSGKTDHAALGQLLQRHSDAAAPSTGEAPWLRMLR